MKGVIAMTRHEELSVMSDRRYAMRAALLCEELEWQIYYKQKSVAYHGEEWNWLEEVFNMLHDIRQLAVPGIPDSERPAPISLAEYRDRFSGFVVFE